jgi:predicted ATPase
VQVEVPPLDMGLIERRCLRRLRRGEPVSARHLEALGMNLTSCIPTSVVAALEEQLQLAPVRLRLQIGTPQLAEFPWELLRLGPAGGEAQFLALQSRLHLIRESEWRDEGVSLPTGPVRVLLAWADPQSPMYAALNFVRREATSVRRALEWPECARFVVDELRFATPTSLLRSLHETRPDVLHFVGHGEFTPSGAALVLEGADPQTQILLHVDELADHLVASGTALAVLNGCCTDVNSCGVPMVPRIAGVPAVVAMQFPITDVGAGLFARALYASLAEGLGIEEAVHSGRCAVRGCGSDWAAPTLTLSRSWNTSSALTEQAFRELPQGAFEGFLYDDRPFIGRVQERADLRRKIRNQEERLITVTGMGGMGKTRLVKQVAAELRVEFDVVRFVDCDLLSTYEDVLMAICGGLGVEGPPDERTLAACCAGRRVLLVLDCFEGLVAHAPLLDRIVAGSATLFLLITSRRSLDLPREHEYVLSPMSEIAKVGHVADAQELFCEAASHALDGFRVTRKNQAVVRQICRTLEGVPLSIVLAAGRLRHEALEDVLGHIETQPLRALRRRGHGQDRHATMQDVVAGSFLLLTRGERQSLCMLAVFQGWFAARDAAVVCCLDALGMSDVLADLRAHSLLQCHSDASQTQYKLLDTVREYAASVPLEGDDLTQLSACRDRHAELLARKATHLEQLMARGQWASGTRELWQELGNYRIAATHCVSAGLDHLLCRLADGLLRSYFEAGLRSDFETLADAALVAAARLEDLGLRSRVLGLKGAHASRKGDDGAAKVLWQERADLCRTLGDISGCADALIDLAWQAYEQGNVGQAEEHLSTAASLAEVSLNDGLIATVQVVRARIALADGRVEEARVLTTLAEQTVARTAGGDLALFVYQNLTRAYEGLGQLQDALEAASRVLSIAADGHRLVHVGWALLELAPRYAEAGDLTAAALCYLAATRVHNEQGSMSRRRVLLALQEFQSTMDTPIQELLHEYRSRPWRSILDEIPCMKG